MKFYFKKIFFFFGRINLFLNKYDKLLSSQILDNDIYTKNISLLAYLPQSKTTNKIKQLKIKGLGQITNRRKP